VDPNVRGAVTPTEHLRAPTSFGGDSAYRPSLSCARNALQCEAPNLGTGPHTYVLVHTPDAFMRQGFGPGLSSSSRVWRHLAAKARLGAHSKPCVSNALQSPRRPSVRRPTAYGLPQPDGYLPSLRGLSSHRVVGSQSLLPCSSVLRASVARVGGVVAGPRLAPRAPQLPGETSNLRIP
jgi:hypothetical protein